MKITILFSVFLCLFNCLSQAQDKNPEPKFLVEKYWTGLSEQNASFTRSGKVQLKQSLILTLTSDSIVTGKAISIFIIDGKEYSSSSSVAGVFRKKTWEIFLNKVKYTYKEAMPAGLEWKRTENINLKFFINDSKPGHYLLKGKIFAGYGDYSSVEYSDL